MCAMCPQSSPPCHANSRGVGGIVEKSGDVIRQTHLAKPYAPNLAGLDKARGSIRCGSVAGWI